MLYIYIPLGALPVAFCLYQEPDTRQSLGPMDVECPHCHALHFKCEKLTNSSVVNPKFGICCLQSQIQLPPISQPPPLLHQLLTSSTPHTQKLRDGICQYNSAFAFTSVAVNVNQSVLNGCGPYSFRMHGEMCHKVGALIPQDNQATLTACNNRNSNLDSFLMGELQDMLITNNPFVPLYKQAHQIMQETPPELQSHLQMTLVL